MPHKTNTGVDMNKNCPVPWQWHTHYWSQIFNVRTFISSGDHGFGTIQTAIKTEHNFLLCLESTTNLEHGDTKKNRYFRSEHNFLLCLESTTNLEHGDTKKNRYFRWCIKTPFPQNLNKKKIQAIWKILGVKLLIIKIIQWMRFIRTLLTKSCLWYL